MKTTSSWRNWGLLALGVALAGGGSAFYVLEAPGETAAPVALATPADLATAPAQVAVPDPDLPLVKVWKSPTCGCCSLWVEHMRKEGFTVEVEDLPDLTQVKHEHGVAPELQSCHTALVDGYVIEGHVPAEDIKRLLEERPQVVGLAVPGMPTGAPGMEYGDVKNPYDVLTFDRAGKTAVWAKR